MDGGNREKTIDGFDEREGRPRRPTEKKMRRNRKVKKFKNSKKKVGDRDPARECPVQNRS